MFALSNPLALTQVFTNNNTKSITLRAGEIVKIGPTITGDPAAAGCRLYVQPSYASQFGVPHIFVTASMATVATAAERCILVAQYKPDGTTQNIYVDASRVYGLEVYNSTHSQFIVDYGVRTEKILASDTVATIRTRMQTAANSANMPDPLRLSAGSAAAPTYSFSGDTDSGMFSQGTNQLGFAAGGILAWTLINNAGQIQGELAGQYLGIDGSASTPAYAFSSDPSTGWYLKTTNDLRITVAGVDSWAWDDVAGMQSSVLDAVSVATGSGPNSLIKSSGTIEITGLTAAADASETTTFTLPVAAAGIHLTLNQYNGTWGVNGNPVVVGELVGAALTVRVINTHGTNALNGKVIVAYTAFGSL